jgi:hypothetical protein
MSSIKLRALLVHVVPTCLLYYTILVVALLSRPRFLLAISQPATQLRKLVMTD